MKLLVMADDLTGTLEAAAILAGCGIGCRLQALSPKSLYAPEASPGQSLVVNLDTRHLPPDEAFRSVFDFVATHGNDYDFVYKKTDSTLRGNISAELCALASFRPIMFVPAYPEVGRIVDGGKLFVDNLPIEQSEFANDPFHPCHTGDIASLFRGHPKIVVYDAATIADMDLLAHQWLTNDRWAAGPCGLLRSLARRYASEANGASALPAFTAHRVLVLCGSLHARSRLQLQQAESLLESGRWTLIATPAAVGSGSRLPAVASAQDAARQFQNNPYDACIVFGGDTAMALLHALGVSSLRPLGEILPGVAVCRLPDHRILITKAGGFGPPELLQIIHDRHCAAAS